MPTPEEQTLQAYESDADSWTKKHGTVGFYNEELAKFKNLLPSGKILEIGSGGGRDAKQLIASGYDYVGTDISPALIRVAQQENPDATFLAQGVYDLDFPEGTQFDGFWASAVLLQIPKAKIDQALQRIRKFVRNDGIGFISLKPGEGEGFEAREGYNSEFKRYFSRYSNEEFTEVLARNNFKVLDAHMLVAKDNDKQLLCFFVRTQK